MKFLIAEKLSSHKFKTPEGYLVCVDSVLSRTGKQTYKKNEVFTDSDDETEIEVDRKESEVFSDEALASFENKPITIEHPNEDVNTSNHNELAVGFVRDIHRGKIGNNDVMLGTLVITDQDAINMVESGELTDLSCGYDCDIVDDNGYQQTNIRGNHVALCEQGRAGIAHIVDSINDAVPTTIEQIQKAISDEIQTINLYDDMIEHLDLTEAQLARIKEIRDDENDHLVHLSNMLQTITEEKIEVKDSMKDAVLPAAIKKDIQRILAAKSTYTKYDLDVSDIIKEIERYCKIDGHPVTFERQSIKGWFKTGDGMMRKDYIFTIKGFSNRILISMYADPDTWKTTEVNGYFMDSVNDALVELSSRVITMFENKLRNRNINIVAKGRTMTGRRHYQVDYAGPAKKLAQLLHNIDLEMNAIDVPMTYAISSNDSTHSTAGIDLDKQYVKDSDIKDVKEYRIFVNGSERVKWEANSAEEAVKEFMELNPAYANHKKGHVEARDCDIEISDDEVEKFDDACAKDAMQTFEIRWIDTYKKSKGYVKEEYLHLDKIKANSLSEALKKLTDIVALRGIGTANALITSIHSDKSSYMHSGRLSELLRNVRDSKISKALDAIKFIKSMKK